MRSAVAERDAEALGIAVDDVGPHFAWRNHEGRRQEIGAHRRERPSLVRPSHQRAEVLERAVDIRILEQDAEHGTVNLHGAVRLDADLDAKRLYVVSIDTVDRKRALKTIAIDNKATPAETFMEDIRRYELSLDRKKLLVQKGEEFYILDAAAKAPAGAELAKTKVDLAGWTFRLDPRDEWRQMLVDAWRMERDYFYDRGMHGVDWPAVPMTLN